MWRVAEVDSRRDVQGRHLDKYHYRILVRIMVMNQHDDDDNDDNTGMFSEGTSTLDKACKMRILARSGLW